MDEIQAHLFGSNSLNLQNHLVLKAMFHEKILKLILLIKIELLSHTLHRFSCLHRFFQIEAPERLRHRSEGDSCLGWFLLFYLLLSELKGAHLQKVEKSSALLQFVLVSPIDLERKLWLALGFSANTVAQLYRLANTDTSFFFDCLFPGFYHFRL